MSESGAADPARVADAMLVLGGHGGGASNEPAWSGVVEGPALDGDDLVNYRKLAGREDPFGLRSWSQRMHAAPL